MQALTSLSKLFLTPLIVQPHPHGFPSPFAAWSLSLSFSASNNKLSLFESASSDDATDFLSPSTALFSLLNSSARFKSGERGPALGGGVDDGVLLPQPLRFSLAHVPHEEKYAPADLEAALRLAWAWERSGACALPGKAVSIAMHVHLVYQDLHFPPV